MPSHLCCGARDSSHCRAAITSVSSEPAQPQERAHQHNIAATNGAQRPCLFSVQHARPGDAPSPRCPLSAFDVPICARQPVTCAAAPSSLQLQRRCRQRARRLPLQGGQPRGELQQTPPCRLPVGNGVKNSRDSGRVNPAAVLGGVDTMCGHDVQGCMAVRISGNRAQQRDVVTRRTAAHLWWASAVQAASWRAAAARRIAAFVSATAHSCASAQPIACARCVAASAIGRNTCDAQGQCASGFCQSATCTLCLRFSSTVSMCRRRLRRWVETLQHARMLLSSSHRIPEGSHCCSSLSLCVRLKRCTAAACTAASQPGAVAALPPVCSRNVICVHGGHQQQQWGSLFKVATGQRTCSWLPAAWLRCKSASSVAARSCAAVSCWLRPAMRALAASTASSYSRPCWSGDAAGVSHVRHCFEQWPSVSTSDM